MDFGIMLILLGLLVGTLSFQSKYEPNGNDAFFDINNSKAMRGFWCIVVILVHVPAEHQNQIQDMIGSFAYIGVSFFFMTSAFGLATNLKKHNTLRGFWLMRLPNLLIPDWLVNLVFAILSLVFLHSPLPWSIIVINPWVKNLLVCYFFFWVSCLFFKTEKARTIGIITGVFLFSFVFKILDILTDIELRIWYTELFGFIWGILLYRYYEPIKHIFQKHWKNCCIILLITSLLLGILYLYLKPVVFFGDYCLKIVLGLSILSLILALNSKIRIGNKVNLFLGEISFEVYLIHEWAFTFVSKWFPNLCSSVFILLSIIITILFSTIIHHIAKKLISMCKKATVAYYRQ